MKCASRETLISPLAVLRHKGENHHRQSLGREIFFPVHRVRGGPIGIVEVVFQLSLPVFRVEIRIESHLYHVHQVAVRLSIAKLRPAAPRGHKNNRNSSCESFPRFHPLRGTGYACGFSARPPRPALGYHRGRYRAAPPIPTRNGTPHQISQGPRSIPEIPGKKADMGYRVSSP